MDRAIFGYLKNGDPSLVNYPLGIVKMCQKP